MWDMKCEKFCGSKETIKNGKYEMGETFMNHNLIMY